MELLTLNRQTFEVELNKAWLMMIPEFRNLIKKDKGSPGDTRGTDKRKATQEFSYIYLMIDWGSPFRNFDENERHAEAMRCVELDEKDVNNEDVEAAMRMYQELMYKASRALKTVQMIKGSLEAVDNYFETIDFTKVDKQGKLLHDMSSFLPNIKKAREAYSALDDFEKMVQDQLTSNGGIQGDHKLGVREQEFAFGNKERSKFKETDGMPDDMKLSDDDFEQEENDEDEDDFFKLGTDE